MLHFIPAWYQQGKWCENEQYWRVRRMYTEFDDTVKQVQQSISLSNPASGLFP